MKNMLNAALWYAKHSYYIFPLHEPIFADGDLVGCTCEEYRTSDKCKADHPHLYLGPDGKCDNPGKCPRVRWKDRATSDEEQIRRWWTKWPRANIGINCGMSRLLVLDADTYKEVYGDLDSMLSQEEQGTVTSLTGGGGEHLFYRMQDGDTYGNATGELPAGIDIRGHGGYIVAPPSIHKSGRKYQFEIGYGLHEMDPLPMPAALRSILDSARSTPQDVHFDTDLEKPDLSAWKLSGKTVRLIYEGQNTNDRSSTDQSVISALLKAGATDDEIRAVFAHYPVGEGKYAERGDEYLAHSIGRARTYLNGSIAGHRNGYSNGNAGAVADKGELQPEPVAQLDTTADFWLTNSADDQGNALCVNAAYPNRFLYTKAYGWLANAGTHWTYSELAERDVNLAITDTLITRRTIAVRAEAEAIVKATRSTSKNKASTKEQYKDLVWRDVSTFDSEKHLLNCKSGVIDLRSGKLLTAEASSNFTYCVNAEYQPGARADSWLSFLSGVLKDYDNVAEWFQMACGYSITGFTNEEVMFYLFGPTRSGKGTFTNAFLNLLGSPLAAGINFGTFTARRDGDSQNFDLARLKPSRFIAASESGKYQALNEAVIKQITGNDAISASFKGKDHFEYFPQFKVWLSSNHGVRGDVDDDAFWGRVKVIEFPNSHMGNEDKALKSRMATPEAMSALLAWAVEGARMWYNDPHGLKTPSTIAESTAKQRADLDSVGQWLDECAILGDFETPNVELYASYVKWCKDEGHEPKHSIMFGRAMNKKPGITSIKIRKPNQNPARGYHGVALSFRT
jgi:putative DNA primase/helicase